MLKVGIDTGGTFTDFVLFDGRSVRTLKVLSTPADPSVSILKGLDELGAADTDAGCEVVHGSTVATNALLERKGARTALITTRGFEDVLEIGRQNRPQIYSLEPSRPAPLVPSKLRFGITERVLYDGSVLVQLRRAELRSIAARLRQERVDSLAVCLLFSFANPTHERAIARELANLGIPLSLSHVILPEYREYERTSTTVVNAYLAPVMGRYLGSLERHLGSRRRSLRIMQSNGGSVSGRVAIREPVRTILSGPAGGVVGAWHVARQAGHNRIITFDMGGTSTDVALCDGGIRVTNESVIAHNPIGIPVIDIHTVGAGGGSIARVDQGGALRVGPESAGADPGPICYGRGDRVTVTDANLLLGRLDASYPLGGALRLETGRLRPAFEALARSIGAGDPVAAAQGVVAVANANMEAALRVISVERGHDPRDFTLVTFGGAGGLHALDLSQALSIPRVLVPAHPGLLSALGVLLSDVVQDFARTVMLHGRDAAPEVLERRFAALEKKAVAAMRKEGFGGSRLRLERMVDMRYRGQSYEIGIPYSRSFEAAFHRLHERRYGYSDRLRDTEVVTLRVRARGVPPKPRIPRHRAGSADPARARIGSKPVRFGRRFRETPIYERARLQTGNVITGPALVFEYSASTAIPPGFACRVDEFLNLLIECQAEA
jgi:N-methylhydantoinase A